MERMPGASPETRPIKALNANWAPGAAGGDGQFEIMIVTDDDEQPTMAVSPASMGALAALIQIDPVLLWDPTNRTLIAGNIVGTWLPRG